MPASYTPPALPDHRNRRLLSLRGTPVNMLTRGQKFFPSDSIVNTKIYAKLHHEVRADAP
jgi:hypothetical protein